MKSAVIEGWPLCMALRKLLARATLVSDWRKLPNGRIIRFFNYKQLAERKRP